MVKKVTIILESEFGKDAIEVDADLWNKFKAKAKKLEVDVRSLFIIALDAYLRLGEEKCPACGELVTKIGPTQTGIQLYGCPGCRLVYWREK